MFDPSAPHIIILLIVILLLFGSARLPRAAKSLGQSMHIFKRSVSGMDVDDETAANPFPPAQANPFPPAQASQFPPAQSAAVLPPAAAPVDHAQTQAQLADLQRQIAELQKQSAGGNAEPTNQF
jgi:sec-independent protein translocase protein TatA